VLQDRPGYHQCNNSRILTANFIYQQVALTVSAVAFRRYRSTREYRLLLSSYITPPWKKSVSRQYIFTVRTDDNKLSSDPHEPHLDVWSQVILFHNGQDLSAVRFGTVRKIFEAT